LKDLSMSVYTVHQPPLRAADDLADTDRFLFVRDGFSWWAFLLTPLWMLRHRLWLVLTIYLLATAAIDSALRALGASASSIVLISVLISLFAGLEAGTLRRLTLSRRGWRNVGVVSGHDAEEAERRFFDAWVRQASARHSAPPRPPASSSAQPMAADALTTDRSGVIGLFPEPGGHR
jgi:Protein of unknown function (DUF2628)